MLISFELEAEEEPEEFLLGQILVQTTQILLFKRDRRKRNGIQNTPQRARSTSWWVLEICVYLVCINFQSILDEYIWVQISTTMKRFHNNAGKLFKNLLPRWFEVLKMWVPLVLFIFYWHHLWADQGKLKNIPDLIATFREEH